MMLHYVTPSGCVGKFSPLHVFNAYISVCVESVEPDEPEESDFQQDNVGHNPPAKPNASPASAQSSSDESPPVDRKDMPSNGNNSLLSRGNTFRSKED